MRGKLMEHLVGVLASLVMAVLVNIWLLRR